MKEIIYSITEAFSQQPVTYYLGQAIYPSQVKVAVITKEPIFHTGDPFDYYVGRDEKGSKLFEFRAETVNVTYQNPQP